MNERYKEEYAVAIEYDWTIDESTIQRNGPSFNKGYKHLWQIRNGWQCADLIDGHYCNHRPYTHLYDALIQEA